MNEEQDKRSEQNLSLPVIECGLVKSDLTVQQTDNKRCTRYEDGQPEW